MSSFLSGKLSSGPLFSYTFPDRPSFLTSFWMARSPRATFSPFASTVESPWRRAIPREFSVSVWAFVLFSRRFGEAARFRASPLTSQSKLEPRCVVKRILACFPAARKRSCKMGAPVPTGRKTGIAVSRLSPQLARPILTDNPRPWARIVLRIHNRIRITRRVVVMQNCWCVILGTFAPVEAGRAVAST